MKAISVSAELLVLQRAVQGVADSLDVEKIDQPVSEDHQRQATAMLNRIAGRLRDFGRACRGTLGAAVFAAPHNTVDQLGETNDVCMNPAEAAVRSKK